MYNVLIVEDQLIPANYLKAIINSSKNFKVNKIATNAKEVKDFLKNNTIDVIFMDIMIQGPISGAELAFDIHIMYPNIQIIFLTAYSEDEMLEYAVNSNAFAYLLKPYREQEIIATLKLLESHLKDDLKNISFLELKENFFYDKKRKKLYKNNNEIILSPKELELVDILCKNYNTTITKNEILNKLQITDTSLRSLIYRIRKKTDENLILNHKRYGYGIGLR